MHRRLPTAGIEVAPHYHQLPVFFGSFYRPYLGQKRRNKARLFSCWFGHKSTSCQKITSKYIVVSRAWQWLGWPSSVVVVVCFNKFLVYICWLTSKGVHAVGTGARRGGSKQHRKFSHTFFTSCRADSAKASNDTERLAYYPDVPFSAIRSAIQHVELLNIRWISCIVLLSTTVSNILRHVTTLHSTPLISRLQTARIRLSPTSCGHLLLRIYVKNISHATFK